MLFIFALRIVMEFYTSEKCPFCGTKLAWDGVNDKVYCPNLECGWNTKVRR